MRTLPLALGLAVSLVSIVGPDPGLAQDPPGAPPAECVRSVSERFVFHSDPWINLHHFLFQWARNVPDRAAGDGRRAIEVTERTNLGLLDAAERQSWERALTHYRERLIDRDLLFDRDLIAVRGALAAIACDPDTPVDIEPELWTVLADAMPVYRRHWWADHHAANQAWIGERLDQLATYEQRLATALADAYGGAWPSERIRVDVVAYANWAGAYTTNRPDHVTLSSAAYGGLGGLETLFHEVSHAAFFEQPILRQLGDAFRSHDARPPDRLSHVIQFVTPAELVASLLRAEGRGPYRSVAEGVLERGSMREAYPVVLEHWRPFLAGGIDRSEAFDRIAAAILQLRPR